MNDPAGTTSGQFWEDVDATQALVDTVDDGIYQLDPDGRFVAVNDAITELSDYDREELLGEHVSRLLADSDAGEILGEIQRHGTGENPTRTLALATHTADGDAVPCEHKLCPLTEDGEFRGVVGVVRDVSDRREMEAQLREREQRLSALIDNVPGMVYRCGDERGWPMKFVSDACEELTGYDPDALESGELSWGEDVMVQQDREGLWRSVHEATADGESFSETYRIETADGEIKWVRDYGRGVFDDGGNLVDVEGIISDVTDAKRTERRLAEERDMFADGPAVVFRWTPDEEAGWPVEYVSENVEEVLGYTPDEFESGAIAYADLLLDDETDRIAREVEENSDGSTERFSHEPYRVRTRDGEVRWVKDTTKIVRDSEGEITNFLGYLVDITDRKERELELRQYETIVETINDGVYVVDEDERFTMVNEAYVEMTGYDREDLLGEHVSLVVDEAVAERAQRTETEMRRGAVDAPTVEAELRSADGERIPSEAGFALLPSRDGSERRVGVARDISERKERERELRRNKEQLETLFEVLPVGVVVAEADGELVAANDTAHEIWGGDVFDAETVAEYERYAVRWADSGEQVPPEEMTLARVVDGEEVTEPDVFEIDAADGERRIIELEGRPIRDENGEVSRGVVTMSDVTERREAQRQLEKSEQRYRTLAEHFPNGAVGVYDHDLRYVLVEGAIWDEIGPDPEDLEGNAVDEALPSPAAEDLEGLFRTALTEERIESVVTEFTGRIFRVWATPLRDADGEIFAGLSFSMDVTEQIERKRQLEELVEDLEKSNERLEQFAHAASHDLQEPLRMVSSYLQLIEQRHGDELSGEAEEYLEFAVGGADRMREMIDSLLAYSRVEARGEPLEPVDLNGVLEDVREDLRFKVDANDADIAAESLPRVEGDAGQLRQVFQNLLDNAVEYGGDDPTRIEVGAERRGDEWELSVSDDGIGIDPDDQERIFEVFQRLHARDEHSGTGIGLALCERIVERHGGEIRVDSEPGEGTTFTFTLPAASERED